MIDRDLLLAWAAAHPFSDLPWRQVAVGGGRDPYRVWLSEVMLQQTRVDQAWGYFERFLARFPSVADLATASSDEVMQQWQGLGYYSRARNLHAAARQVVEQFGGVFPTQYSDVRSLKGVGEYTAAAICAFAYDQPYAVVDGNVYRILARVAGEATPIDTTSGRTFFAQLADGCLDRSHPRVYNEAMMDLGRTVCVPKNPKCADCPLSSECRAFGASRVEDFPVKQGRVAVSDRYLHYMVYRVAGRTWIRRRGERDIWAGLYEFPMVECTEAGPMDLGVAVFDGGLHRLTHRRIFSWFYEMDGVPTDIGSDWLEVEWGELGKRYAVSRLIEKYVQRT